MTTTPLSGLRVLDLTNVLAGPFCAHQLAHLGAEVIKVEAPGRGDLARQLGADPALNDAGMGVSFLAQNAGKKSVTNSKRLPARKAFLRLVESADVVLENFRPGVMSRLGLDYPVLKQARQTRFIAPFPVSARRPLGNPAGLRSDRPGRRAHVDHRRWR